MKCPVCGGATLTHNTRDVVCAHKGLEQFDGAVTYSLRPQTLGKNQIMG